MSDQTMQDVLTRLEAQEKELARFRTTQARRSKFFGGRKRRAFTLGIVALLVALVPLSILAATPFTDLQEGSVHNPDIDTIYNLGITTGCSPTEYCPTGNVTRQEMASFLSRTASLNRIAFTSLPSAAASGDLTGDQGTEKEYMNATLTVPGRPGDSAMWVRVSFTGYVYARSSAPVTGTPTLLRGDIRYDGETAGAAQIVTRSVVGANPNAIVSAPASGSTPAVAAAERLDFSGSRVVKLAPGTYTFRMIVRKEVGTANDVGFGFGNMQAETIAFDGTGTRGTTVAP